MPSDASKKKAQAKKEAAARRHTTGASPAGPVQRKEVESTVAAPQALKVLLPACVTPKQRATLHEAAEALGLSHTSLGDQDSRRLTLARGLESAAEVQEAIIPACRPVTLDQFVQQTGPLLELEQAAEVGQAREAVADAQGLQHAQGRGRVVPNLRCSGLEAGLLGRTLMSLVSNKGGGTVAAQPLPPHKLSPHDLVEVRPSKGPSEGAPLASGVVYRVRDDVIVVALDESPDADLDVPMRLHKLANEVTYNRLKATLQTLGQASALQDAPGAPLTDVLFGVRQPRFLENPRPWKAVNTGLDASQCAAVSRALTAQDVALIHGPPGTGKTTAVVELTLQEVARGSKVLAVAASNIAVDNLVERLGAQLPRGQVVRPGHPARLHPSVLAHSLEAAVMRADSSSLARDCRADIKAANARLLKLGRKDFAERRALRAEVRALAKEERRRQQHAVGEVLSRARVVCATLTGVLARDVAPLTFDLVVVDEAAQALEIATWAALLKAPRAVLAGDHLQLPPTIISDQAASQGLARTLFERVHQLFGGAVASMLTVQYRMHASIMAWASEELYGGLLTAHPSVAARSLQDLPGVDPAAAASPDYGPVALIDTAGCDMEEAGQEGGDSRLNEGEAQAALAHAARLVALGVPAADIGIITPYSAQVSLLRERCPDGLKGLEIATVDGFQGREKAAVIISAVRCNPKGEVGFLSDDRRMNVAVTRAQRHVALVCDSETLNRHGFLQRLVGYFEQHGAYLSAAELIQ
ncbi:hypothetical protein WJX73_000065 [Symbiochloris irregularis]|uniref:DNA helicase n=1 Tax=Symbiochloris irregularis TaxID=706552 RepID=A0AAW1PZG5_9CHLO